MQEANAFAGWTHLAFLALLLGVQNKYCVNIKTILIILAEKGHFKLFLNK